MVPSPRRLPHSISWSRPLTRRLSWLLRNLSILLENTPGVGPATCRALLSAFGLPDAIFAASREQLARVVPSAVASALKVNGATILQDVFEGPFGNTFVFQDLDGYAVTVHDKTTRG